MKSATILTVTLLFAGSPGPSTDRVYITEIKNEIGTFHLNNRTYWRVLIPRKIQHWRAGDEVAVARSASCGTDPNVYMVTDTSESESVCAQQRGRGLGAY